MKKLTALAALFCTLSLTVCDADAAKTKAKEQAPMTEEQKTLYALGQLMATVSRRSVSRPKNLPRSRRAWPTAWPARRVR